MIAYLGSQLIGARTSRQGQDEIYGIDPATRKELQPGFCIATHDEVDAAVCRAVEAASKFGRLGGAARARFLRRIAEEIESLGEALIRRAMAETALPEARLVGERGRTCAQLRMFAEVAEEGSWVDARIDRAMPDRQPLPRPDLRRMLVPIGPVAVFGASNFPLAFSVAGGDTASALAAGCPVVVKAHPSHPGTSELVGRAIVKAAVGEGMPDGVFSMVHGLVEVGEWLVQHRGIRAVGFTGSHRAGRSLFALAAARAEPVPVFAEMGSVNPVFALPGALESDLEGVASGFSASLLMGVGQFCTNPGILVGLAGSQFDHLVESVAARIRSADPGVMLNPQICDSYAQGVADRARHSGVGIAGMGETVPGLAVGVVFETSAEEFIADRGLHEEVFGPSALVVKCQSPEEMVQVAAALEGQLTGSILMAALDEELAGRIHNQLVDRVGRVVFNGYPTGVEVGDAMHHGGPYPATTDPRFTSVGRAAILRWARPVCWQGAPPDILPEELRDGNPRGIWRRVDSVMGRE
ncbi:MAG: aldehyde dehydrogenase (NADP(+)) [Armatimonadetes bacterium]|nr:aldehyde dehydrogenase (NADP(+)) [Armatimonadota bacterium]MBS1711075.1 aldehyde dehydrogenase (NADP(+)) [Armatimonadota bacterium]MBX3108747.1 aldehyde dehydrogenase (NADP(+)) [Fimbriimonadaceae bacterium]